MGLWGPDTGIKQAGYFPVSAILRQSGLGHGCILEIP